MKQGKIRVAVLYGGRSAEHEISLESATHVIKNLDLEQFDVIPIGIDKKGNWVTGHEVFNNSLQFKKVSQLTDQHATWFTAEWVGKSVQAKDFQAIKSYEDGSLFDVVFPVVHGPMCEDGTLQGLLELANIPYVGCGVLSSSIGMDKDVSKRLVMQAGIDVPPFVVIKASHWQNETMKKVCQEAITNKLHYPVFVKPANTGSSIGITKVKQAEQLQSAIDYAFEFAHKVVVEKAIIGKELEVAVLESLCTNQEPIVSLVGEIKPKHEFYSYEAKYIDSSSTELIIPASLPSDIEQKIQQTAKKIFTILECEGMARVDLFFDEANQKIYFNEINTIPGFTAISMYPKLMQASGIFYKELLTHLIQLAINRHKHKCRRPGVCPRDLEN